LNESDLKVRLNECRGGVVQQVGVVEGLGSLAARVALSQSVQDRFERLLRHRRRRYYCVFMETINHF